MKDKKEKLETLEDKSKKIKENLKKERKKTEGLEGKTIVSKTELNFLENVPFNAMVSLAKSMCSLFESLLNSTKDKLKFSIIIIVCIIILTVIIGCVEITKYHLTKEAECAGVRYFSEQNCTAVYKHISRVIGNPKNTATDIIYANDPNSYDLYIGGPTYYTVLLHSMNSCCNYYMKDSQIFEFLFVHLLKSLPSLMFFLQALVEHVKNGKNKKKKKKCPSCLKKCIEDHIKKNFTTYHAITRILFVISVAALILLLVCLNIILLPNWKCFIVHVDKFKSLGVCEELKVILSNSTIFGKEEMEAVKMIHVNACEHLGVIDYAYWARIAEIFIIILSSLFFAQAMFFSLYIILEMFEFIKKKEEEEKLNKDIKKKEEDDMERKDEVKEGKDSFEKDMEEGAVKRKDVDIDIKEE